MNYNLLQRYRCNYSQNTALWIWIRSVQDPLTGRIRHNHAGFNSESRLGSESRYSSKFGFKTETDIQGVKMCSFHTCHLLRRNELKD
jgi:hypothetical protein